MNKIDKEIRVAMCGLGMLLLYYVHLGGIVQVRTTGSHKNEYQQCII